MIDTHNLDDLLKPNDHSSKTIKSNADNMKKKLQDLKAQLQADPVVLNTDNFTPNVDDIPDSENIKYIDYAEEKTKTIEYAEQTINTIVNNYISSEKLLADKKIMDVKREQISKLAELQFLVANSDRNLITLQEAIDAGDMSKDMFMMVRDYQVEMRNNIEARSKHIDKCEVYLEKYAKEKGFESKDEKIINDENTNDESKAQNNVRNIRDLNDKIDEYIKQKKTETDKNKKSKD